MPMKMPYAPTRYAVAASAASSWPVSGSTRPASMNGNVTSSAQPPKIANSALPNHQL